MDACRRVSPQAPEGLDLHDVSIHIRAMPDFRSLLYGGYLGHTRHYRNCIRLVAVLYWRHPVLGVWPSDQREGSAPVTAHAASVVAERIQTVFRDPSLEGMISLEWPEFEDFVQHVFTHAGYHVTKVARQLRRNYVDLELRMEPTGAVVAHVEVRRYSTANIIRARVLQFLGALETTHTPRGYIVTTSDFTQPARQVADATDGLVHVVNGRQFLNYIEYVRGSRLTDEQGAPVLLTGEPISPEYILAAEAIPRLDPLPKRWILCSYRPCTLSGSTIYMSRFKLLLP